MAAPSHHYLNFNNSCAIDSFLELAQFTFCNSLHLKEKGELLSLVDITCRTRNNAGKNITKKLLFDIREAVWTWLESKCSSFQGRTSNASFEEILDNICSTSDEEDLFCLKWSSQYSCSSSGCSAFKVHEKKECPVYLSVPQLQDCSNDIGATLSHMFLTAPRRKLFCDNCQERTLECHGDNNVVTLPEYLFVRVPTVNRKIGGVEQLVVYEGIAVPEVIDLGNGQKFTLRGAVRGIGRHFTTAVKIEDQFVHIDGNSTGILTAPSLSQLAVAVKQQYYSSRSVTANLQADNHSYITKSVDGYFMFLFGKTIDVESNLPRVNDFEFAATSSSTCLPHVTVHDSIESSVEPNIPVHNSFEILIDEAETSHDTSPDIHETPKVTKSKMHARPKAKRKLIRPTHTPSKKYLTAKEGQAMIHTSKGKARKCDSKVTSDDVVNMYVPPENSATNDGPQLGRDHPVSVKSYKSNEGLEDSSTSVPFKDITNITSKPKSVPVYLCDNLLLQNGKLYVDIQLCNRMNMLGRDWRPSMLLKRVKAYGFDCTTEIIDIKSVSFISLKVFIAFLFKSSACEQSLYRKTCRELLRVLNKTSLQRDLKWKSFSVHSGLDENMLFVDMNDMHNLLNMKVKRIRPFLHVLKRLSLGDDHFIFKRVNMRSHISLEAFTAILLSRPFSNTLIEPIADILEAIETHLVHNFDRIHEELNCSMWGDEKCPPTIATNASKMKVDMHNEGRCSDLGPTENRKIKSPSGRSTAEILSPSHGMNLKFNRTIKRRLEKQHRSILDIASAIHKGDKESLKQAFMYDINQCRATPSSCGVEWSGCVTSDDLIDILKGVPSLRAEYDNLFDEVACEHARKKFCLSAREVISIIDTNNSNSVVKTIRKSLPLFFDKPKKMQEEWKQLKHEFDVIMRPQVISTSSNSGYKVDPKRLIHCLRHLYYFLPESEWWKVWGDGREIGGKKSCSIALSCINNDMVLHGLQFHSPSEIWPLCIRYGSDGRWSLEDAIGTEVGGPGWLNEWIDEEQSTSNSLFFLSGDSMFLDAVHGMKGEFAPNKASGFNIYSTVAREQKHVTSPVTGFRSGLNTKIDRILKHSLLESIPLTRTVFCIDHACTRIVEKLIELKIKSLCSKKSVVGASIGKDYFISRLDRLKQNMIARCVVKSERIVCSTDGTLSEKISLNKTDAHALLLPCYDGCPYGPLLEGVSSDHVTFEIDNVLQKSLGFSSLESEFKVESALWNCLSVATFLLRDSDPTPVSKADSSNKSLDANDYIWGMSAEKVKQCILNLDLFHKLFVLIYGGDKLTPYMMKLIDATGELLKSLPVPTLMRFSTEGGEHSHYEDATYFYQHTQKGGAGKTEDPIYAIMCHKYRILKSRLVEYCQHSDPKRAKAGWEFLNWVSHEMNLVSNEPLERQTPSTNAQAHSESDSPIYNFYFVGRVSPLLFKNSPISGKDALLNKLHELKCRVLDLQVDQLPKPQHNKTIIMLTQQSQCNLRNPPKALILAIKQNWPIVDVAFALQYVTDPFTNIDSFLLNIKILQSHPFVQVCRPLSYHNTHKRAHVVTAYKTMLRKKAKERLKRCHKKRKPYLAKQGSSFALFVSDANKKLTTKQLKLPMVDRQRIISKMWKELSSEQRSGYALKARERFFKQLKGQLQHVATPVKADPPTMAYERNKSHE